MTDEQIERAARAVHETRYGCEGHNPNCDPNEEDMMIVRAVLAALRGQQETNSTDDRPR